MAGIDVHEQAPAAAVAKVLKRSNGQWADLSQDDKRRLANAGIDIKDPIVSRAIAKLFKR